MSGKIKGYATCPECGKRAIITSSGKIQSHTKDFNGAYYPFCHGSGKVIPVESERGVRPHDKYHYKKLKSDADRSDKDGA